MNHFRTASLAALLVCLPALGACGSDHASVSISDSISSSVAQALDKAQQELRTQPITVSHGDSNLPKAQIMPNGDFVVGGKDVAITPAQRTELLAFRAQVIEVGSQGLAVGKQGAKLGMHAAGTAIAAALSGESDEEIQKQVKAQTKGIREAAAKICDKMPALQAEQQKLAAILPAFKPYATMTQDDVTDCRKDALDDSDD